jgi:co-chaperonin GroES (HSP10)
MRFRPLHNWLLVKAFPHELMHSDIHVTSDNKTVLRTGRVIAAGKGIWNKKKTKLLPMSVRVGDKVAFIRWHKDHQMGKATTRALHEMSEEYGADMFVLHPGDILLVVEDEPAESAALDKFPYHVDVA